MTAMTRTFDGTTYTISHAMVLGETSRGFDVEISDPSYRGGRPMLLETVDGEDLARNFASNMDPSVNRQSSRWLASRFEYVAGLAARVIANPHRYEESPPQGFEQHEPLLWDDRMM